jgi:DNA polymerase III epsilon subunit-like protein
MTFSTAPEPLTGKSASPLTAPASAKCAMGANVRPAVLSRHRGTDVAGVDFVVVDVETTGRGPVSERVIEVAAVRVRDGEVIDEFATLVNPGRAIGNTEHHGITTADVEGAPTWAQVTPTLLSYLSGAVMVCHNAVSIMRSCRMNSTESESISGRPRLCALC